MTILTLSPAIPNLKVPRAYPCSAFVLPEVECGATPASLYLRVCGVVGHERKVWLCPIHATLAVCGGAICKECAMMGGPVGIILYRLTEPVRIP